MNRSTPQWSRIVKSAASATLVTCALFATTSVALTDPLVDRLAWVEIEAATLCPADSQRRPLGQAIDELADELRTAAPAAGHTPVQAVSDLLFKKHAIRPSRDLHDPCNLLPSAVLERKQGYCVGIAALYLALAERLALPIHAVATPSHVFLRLDDGTTRVNIETLQAGASVSDQRYASEEKIASVSIRRGTFLRDLSDDEFLAQVYNNLGVVYSERQQFADAGREYRQALDLDRRLPAAWYNWGTDLLRSGQYSRAVEAFTRSLKLHPNDVWALNNRGVAYLKAGKTEKSRRDFQAALSLDPGFEQARRGLEDLSASP